MSFMSKKTLLTLFLFLSIVAAGLFGWQHLYSKDKILRVYDYQTKKEYVRYPVKTGDKLFFGWIHSWERISWHEYYHINQDNTLELDAISFPAFGAGIPENKGKRTRIEKGRIYMEEIGQIFPHFVWINSHLATREIKVNDVLVTSGRILPEHTRLVLVIERRGLFDAEY